MLYAMLLLPHKNWYCLIFDLFETDKAPIFMR